MQANPTSWPGICQPGHIGGDVPEAENRFNPQELLITVVVSEAYERLNLAVSSERSCRQTFLAPPDQAAR